MPSVTSRINTRSQTAHALDTNQNITEGEAWNRFIEQTLKPQSNEQRFFAVTAAASSRRPSSQELPATESEVQEDSSSQPCLHRICERLNKEGTASPKFCRLSWIVTWKRPSSHRTMNKVQMSFPERHWRITDKTLFKQPAKPTQLSIADLDSTIATQKEAAEATPDGHRKKPYRLSNLGVSLFTRYERLGSLTDLYNAIEVLQEAVEITPDGHPEKPRLVANLGNSFFRRFERLGKTDDLDSAIESHKKAVEIFPDSHPNKPGLLSNAGASLIRRFERFGHLIDVDSAIAAHQKAVDLTPDGHPDKSSRLYNLGVSLFNRFERLGKLTDLLHAIKFQQQAVEITPDGHPDKSSRLNKLGFSFSRRFERLHGLTDLDDAIAAHQKAVEITPDSHPDKPSRLNDLGISLFNRFERLDGPTDLDSAIAVQQRAVAITPDGHPDKPSRLNNLGVSLSCRSKLLGELTGLDGANGVQKKVAPIIPDGHHKKPSRSNNLGVSLSRRFDRFGALSLDLPQMAPLKHTLRARRQPQRYTPVPRKGGSKLRRRRTGLSVKVASAAKSATTARLLRQMKSRLKFMASIRLPALPSPCNWSQIECLKYLNWAIRLNGSEYSLLRPPEAQIITNQNPSGVAPLPLPHTKQRLPWKTEPLGSPAAEIRWFIPRRQSRLEHGSLEVPTTWKPLQNLRPHDLQNIQEGTLKSWSSGDATPTGELKTLLKEQLERRAEAERRDDTGNSSTDEPNSSSDSQMQAGGPQLNAPGSHVVVIDASVTGRPSTQAHEDHVSIEGSGIVTGTSRSSTPAPHRKTIIEFVPRYNYQIGIAQDWDMVIAMNPALFEWKRQYPDVLRYRERNRHVRTLLQTTPADCDTNLPTAITRYLSFNANGMAEHSEIYYSLSMGRLLADIISTPALPAICSLRMPILPSWRCTTQPVELDVACIPTVKALSWDRSVLPVLLAAQFSNGDRDGRDAAESLACAFHASMIVLILYYLDTRSKAEDCFPPWMILYGVIYTTSGFSIQEHYPDYRSTLPGKAKWCFLSRYVIHFPYNLSDPPSQRSRPLAALLRVSGHAQLVLENLQKWKGYKRVIESRFVR